MRARAVASRQLAAQSRDVFNFEGPIAWQQIPHVALTLAEPAMDQERVVSGRFETSGQIDGLNRRAPDVEPRDDARDADWRDGRLGGSVGMWIVGLHLRATVLPAPWGSGRP